MRERNGCLDSVKGLAAIFVVFIHVKFGGIGEYLADFGSWAVPFFFMISGYFAYRAQRQKLKKSILHIIVLIGIAYFLNSIRIFFANSFSITKSVHYLQIKVFNIPHIVSWLVLNTTSVSGVAWFLFALLYCYVFSFLFVKWFQSGTVYYIAAFGFGLGIVAKVIFPIVGFHAVGINNAWMCGIPYFLTGVYFHNNEQKIMLHISDKICVIIIACGIVLKTFGFVSLVSWGYIGDMMLVPSLFTLAIRHAKFECRLLKYMGSKYAFFIYIMHPIMMHIWDAIVVVDYWFVIDIIRPVIVLLSTVLGAILFYKVKDILKLELRR